MANKTISSLISAALPLTGAEKIGAVQGGNSRQFVVSDILQSLLAGTESLPSLAFAADQNTGLLNPAADQIGFAVGGAQKARLSSTNLQVDVPLTGTAVTQSTTDSTAGRLLKVGDFGLGASLSITNFTVALSPGIYTYLESAAVGAPGTGAAYNGYAVVTKNASGGGVVLAVRGSTNVNLRIWVGYRAAATGAFTWIEIPNLAAAVRTVSQSGGVPTGGLFERGSNANGSYTRFADGTQICTSTMAAGAGTATSWTFPAAFSAAPTVHGNAVATVLSAVCLDAAPTTTAATFSALDKTDARRADTCHLTAIGTWF